jgi:glycosyltransferase involved in cell wall biosynthesis
MGVTLRPRRILYVTTDLGGGGAEAMLVRLVTSEPRLANEITVISLLPAEAHIERLRAAGVSLVELNFRGARGIASGVVRLARLIARLEPDIVQGWLYHGDLAALLALLMSGRRSRTKLIWSIRCSEMDLRCYGTALRLVIKACIALSRWPDVVTANSSEGLKSHLALGYRPRRSVVIPNGIEVDRFKPDSAARAALRKELGITQDSFVLAHVARVDPMKDHETLLAALAELPNVVTLLAGTGTERLPTTPNIRPLGRREDVARILAASDAVVSSSAFGEGFSNALAEGMACGLPAVATDVGDAALIVGDTGLTVPPRDVQALASAIRSLAAEPAAARAQQGARARARIAEKFSMTQAIGQFAELYASLDDGRDKA